MGDPHSCQRAREAAIAQCAICAGCPAEAVGCGVFELPTAPSATTVPPGGYCEAKCKLGGQSAKCKDRIVWAAKHSFHGRPDACRKSHNLVVGQCHFCGKCALEHTDCVDSDTVAAPQAQPQRKFDSALRAPFASSSASAAVTARGFAPSGLLAPVLCVGGLAAFSVFAWRAQVRKVRLLRREPELEPEGLLDFD